MKGKIIGFRFYKYGVIGVMRTNAYGFRQTYYKNTRRNRERIQRVCKHYGVTPNWTEYTK